MDNFHSRIGIYLDKSKKKSKLNKTEISESIDIIKAELNNNEPSVELAVNALVELPHSVMDGFFQEAFDTFSPQLKAELIHKLLRVDKMVRNANNFAINRATIIISVLLQKDSDEEYIHTILKFCTRKAPGKDGGIKAGELLFKNCISIAKNKLILLDYSTWQESELRSLTGWLTSAISKTNDPNILPAYHAFIEKYGQSKIINISHTTPQIIPISNQEQDIHQNSVPNTHQAHKDSGEKIKLIIRDLQSEVVRILNKNISISEESEILKNELAQLSKAKADLSRELSDLRVLYEERGRDNRIKTDQIIEMEKEIVMMNQRLKNAFNADKAQQNQELASLTNDLSRRLKLDYDDYKKLAFKEPNATYYDALIGVVENIFDKLRRKGIVVSNENEA